MNEPQTETGEVLPPVACSAIVTVYCHACGWVGRFGNSDGSAMQLARLSHCKGSLAMCEGEVTVLPNDKALVRLHYSNSAVSGGGSFASVWMEENGESFRTAMNRAKTNGLSVDIERQPNLPVSHAGEQQTTAP